MAFSPSFPIAFLLLNIFLCLLTSSLSSPPLRTPARIHLTHLHASQNYTKLQLLQRALPRSKTRMERLSMMATSATVATMQSPVYSGEGEFLMNISIGTPPKPFFAIVDTGSDLIWTQCSPCTKCFDQPTPIFDPKNSSTYSPIPCSDDLCKDMNIFRCNNGCNYLYTYGDQSSSQGYMAMETFTFLDSTNSKPVSVPNIGFGCGVNNQGSGFVQGSGLVGLGRGPLSLISQLGFKKFSYCLTSIGANKTSSLLLGSLADFNYSTTTNDAKWTPLIQSSYQPTFYYLDLQGISVGETLLPISNSMFKLREDGSGGMIIDSGTTISYIQENAFEMLKKEFSSQMKLRVTKSDSGGLDLCFDLPTNDLSEIKVPKLKFHFKGFDLDLPVENYMIADTNIGLVCLGMAASNSISILGNVQQQNFLILHDLEKEGWIGMGAVARDHEGKVLAAAVRRVKAWWPAQIAEGRALLLGIKMAKSMGFENILLESDCQSLIQRLSKALVYLSDFDNVLEDILVSCNSFNSVKWNHVRRDGNRVAHHLAKLMPFGTEQTWVNHCPCEITPYVIADISSLN